MPNSPSAIKRMRSDARKHRLNQIVLAELKTLDHRLRKLENDPEQAQKTAQKLISRYDRAVSKGVIPRGRADRKKSRIAALLRKLKK